jgi:hypothetical protein
MKNEYESAIATETSSSIEKTIENGPDDGETMAVDLALDRAPSNKRTANKREYHLDVDISGYGTGQMGIGDGNEANIAVGGPVPYPIHPENYGNRSTEW